MTPTEIEARLRAARPLPSPGLRARILAIPMGAPRPPWWARTRTWAAAAAVLLLADWLIIAEPAAPPPPDKQLQALALDPAITAELPPLYLALLLRPPPPVPSDAPIPFLFREEILR